MNTSVGTKVKKKQSTLSAPAALPAVNRELEQSLLVLENACMRVLESHFANGRFDTEGRCWQQRFKNIATPVSLALAECKGPRRFHYHYKHREDDDSVLQPVLENPFDTLANACRHALRASYTELVGIDDDAMVEMRDMLETALGHFLEIYKDRPSGKK